MQRDYRMAELARAMLAGGRKGKWDARAFARAASELDPPHDVTLTDLYNLEGVAQGVRWPPPRADAQAACADPVTAAQGK